MKIATHQIGNEKSPVLIVDDFWWNPAALVDLASHLAFQKSDTAYPGIRAPLPPLYTMSVRAALNARIIEAFGLEGHHVTRETSDFYMITTDLAALRPLQRLPHTDSPDNAYIAVLHFLCAARFAGTSFFRQNRTGFESVDASRSDTYASAVKDELAVLASGPTDEDEYAYERIATFSLVFNRALVYRSTSLHRANFAPGVEFDSNPRIGRLTANTFFQYKPHRRSPHD